MNRTDTTPDFPCQLRNSTAEWLPLAVTAAISAAVSAAVSVSLTLLLVGSKPAASAPASSMACAPAPAPAVPVAPVAPAAAVVSAEPPAAPVPEIAPLVAPPLAAPAPAPRAESPAEPPAARPAESRPAVVNRPLPPTGLPESYKAKGEADLARVLSVIEHEAMANGVPEETARGITSALHVELRRRGELTLRPRAVFHFIVKLNAGGASPDEIAARLKETFGDDAGEKLFGDRSTARASRGSRRID